MASDMLLLNDDFTGCMFTYFLKQKSDASRALEKILADIAPYGKAQTKQCGYTIVLLVWVDDIIITSSKDELLNTVKIQLKNRFNMKDLGTLSSFLGIDFERGIDYVTMSQSRYLKNVLIRFSLNDCKPRNTPCEQNPAAYILDETSDTEKTDNDTKLYRQMVGSIVYAMTCSRPDLSYVVTKLSQHLSKPENSDCIMLKHVFRYIKNTVSYTFTFRKLNHKEFRLYAFCDANWASSLDNRRSITGYCISINPSGPPISWRSKKQASVALSTCEAEYMALSLTAQETAHLTRLIKDLTNFHLKPPVIKNDNQGALALLKNPVKHMKAKHIDIRYHYIRECFQQNQIAVEYIPSSENKADIFTKPPKKHLLTMFKQYLFGETALGLKMVELKVRLIADINLYKPKLRHQRNHVSDTDQI
ncbi:uncharacterized protein LOC130629914 [Hydractinia symbiolongicarpus]|uniref:uncharacterized protein LOC130629914 n=1 Tax=Hydractinia symbiolongicarpus TaxID=13093 RepID=UPI0025511DE9|nr:uncharacterized protein LOC130629914 [Hydractinia symbiolongicarpus]